MLLEKGRIRRTVSSYVGSNKEFARQYLAGELEVELTPQGTLAERMRAGGAGIPAFFTPAGVGTQVADGGLPLRYDGSGGIAVRPPRKETRDFDGVTYVMEEASSPTIALVHAWKGDRHGNLVYRASTQNFNPAARRRGGSPSRRSSTSSSRGTRPCRDPHTGHSCSASCPRRPGRSAVENRTVRADA